MHRAFPHPARRVVAMIGLAMLVGSGLALMVSAAEAFPTPSVQVPPLDAGHGEFATVLRAVVRDDGVDYASLRRDHSALDRYRAQIAKAPLPQQREERLALFINAYNAHTLALVVAKLPDDENAWSAWSIKKAGKIFTSVWKSYTFEVAGDRYTLDQIEHAVLRPMGEPRIHVAINCAARSCPPMLQQPLLAAGLDTQLEAAAVAFATSPLQVRLEKDVLRVNPILEWFAEDFERVGGIRAFLQARVPAGPIAEYLASDRPIRFSAYDWALNLAARQP